MWDRCVRQSEVLQKDFVDIILSWYVDNGKLILERSKGVGKRLGRDMHDYMFFLVRYLLRWSFLRLGARVRAND